MKISVRQECGYVDLETESEKDFYVIGRIAANFKSHASSHDGKKRRLELNLDKVIEKLSE